MRLKKTRNPRNAYLKRFYPKGIFGRFALMVAAPMLVTLTLAVFMFYTRHWDTVSRHMIHGLTGEIAVLADLAAAVNGDPQASRRFLYARERLYLDAYLTDDTLFARPPETPVESGLIPGAASRRIGDITLALATRLRYPFYCYYTEDGMIRVNITLPDRKALTVRISPKRISNPSTYIFVLWLTGAGALTALIAILFMRNQLRAVTKLAEAMRDYGAGGRAEGYKPFGAREVRQAGDAFMRMRRRINRFVQVRTDMLTGISHDLKTPITRIKLQLALLPDTPETADINRDLDEMREMIDSYLGYLRDEETENGAPQREAEVISCIKEALMKYTGETAAITAYFPEDGAPLTVRTAPVQLRRAFENCLQNALKYGNGAIEIKAERSKHHAVITIEDNGEGISRDIRDTVFRPFTRGGKAAKKAEGSGLGLAIVRDIVKKAGGTVRLERGAKLGGARCRLRLPLAEV